MMKTPAFLLAVALMGASAAENSPPAPAVPARETGISWVWTGEPKAGDYAAALMRQGFKVDMKSAKSGDQLSFTVTNPDGKEIYQWKGHSASSFIVAEDTLYVAQSSVYSPSITIVTASTKTGEKGWSASMPPVVPYNSKYHNRTNLRFENGGLRVYSKQSAGQGVFWWLVSTKDGAVLESHPAEHFAEFERNMVEAKRKLEQRKSKRSGAERSRVRGQ